MAAITDDCRNGMGRRLLRTIWHRARGFARRVSRPPLEDLPLVPWIFRDYRFLCAHPDVERRPGGWLYRGRLYPDTLTVGAVGPHIFRQALALCRGKGIDVGAGFWPLPGAEAVDLVYGEGAGRSVSSFGPATLDYVFSSHCLEHIEDWRPVLAGWVDKVRPGGVVFLYLPHPDCEIWHPGSPFVGDRHKWVPTPDAIKQALCDMGCEIVGCDEGPDGMWSFYVAARKLGQGMR